MKMGYSSLTTNVNLNTGIAYGYISGHSLNADLLQELQDAGEDLHYKEALSEAIKAHEREEEEARIAHAERGDGGEFEFDDFDPDEFSEDWEDSEPVHAGTLDGVNYQTSWLGGALNVWIFESPHITECARRASPCVPGAGILDTLDGDVQCYDVPEDWRHVEQ